MGLFWSFYPTGLFKVPGIFDPQPFFCFWPLFETFWWLFFPRLLYANPIEELKMGWSGLAVPLGFKAVPYEQTKGKQNSTVYPLVASGSFLGLPPYSFIFLSKYTYNSTQNPLQNKPVVLATLCFAGVEVQFFQWSKKSKCFTITRNVLRNFQGCRWSGEVFF